MPFISTSLVWGYTGVEELCAAGLSKMGPAISCGYNTCFLAFFSKAMKLTYFDVRGRIDPVRLMLEATGHPYTFNGIQFGESREEWLEKKKYTPTPFGSLPYLEIVNEDGTTSLFSQSLAIARLDLVCVTLIH